MRWRCMWKPFLNCRIFYNYKVPSSSSCTIHTSMWKVWFQTIINQVIPFCTLLQPEAKIQPEKKSWQPDKTQTENKNEQEHPHTQREQTRTTQGRNPLIASTLLPASICLRLRKPNYWAPPGWEKKGDASWAPGWLQQSRTEGSTSKAKLQIEQQI